MPIDMHALRRFARLKIELAELDARLKQLQKELSVIEEGLLDQFGDEGVKQVRVEGILVYLYRQTWAHARNGNYEKACRWLARHGLRDFVHRRFDVQTLSAYVRERRTEEQEGGEGLPKGFEKVVTVTDNFSLRVRKG